MCSDSEKNMSAFADQNHAPSLTCVRLELIEYLTLNKDDAIIPPRYIKIKRIKFPNQS